MRVFVLGHRGMLGHVVARYFAEQGLDVLTTEERYAGAPLDPLIQAVLDSKADWVVNAIGKNRPSAGQADLFLHNTILPVHLKSSLRNDQRMIHSSTDGVFSGKKGNYKVDDFRDAEDDYCFSKVLSETVAEPGKCYVIRTSIIGPELNGNSSLMSWFLSQREPVKGYTNHYWNGITTLEWAKVCQELIERKFSSPTGIIQTGSPGKISKFELLRQISEIWEHPVVLQPVSAPQKIDRSLILEFPRPAIRRQLVELRAWH